MRHLPAPALLLIVLVAATPAAFGDDWPQYRHDAGRTAAAPQGLPATLHLQWTRELPPPSPAFPGEIRLGYDATYEPVAAGKSLFVPSMVSDSVTALDTDTGEERWQFFTEGPVRFAPAVWEGRVYFGSDDGYLYCVGAEDGKLLWKFRGVPDRERDRKIMGNGRLVSLFPARGGPVVAGGIVYFAAGIWSGEGVFVHALDAASGEAVWSNTDSDAIEKANMDHGVAQIAGISPQGYLAIVDGRLVVPCGTQLPAILNLKTGKLDTYTMGWGGRTGLPKGCWFVAGVRQYLMHAGGLYDMRKPNEEQFREKRGNEYKSMLYPAALTRLQIDPTNQKGLGQFQRPVLTSETMYQNEPGIVARDLTRGEVKERKAQPIPADRREDKYPDKFKIEFPERWRLSSGSKVMIKAGDRLYCGGKGVIEAVDIPEPEGKPGVSWRGEIEGTPESMLAADGKLFVVTQEGKLFAFGGEKRAEPCTHAPSGAASPEQDEWTGRAAGILERCDPGGGYVLVPGIGTGRLIEELVRQRPCHVIAIDPDAGKAARLREKFHRAGLYGTRISIFVGDPLSYAFPPYFASLIVSEDRGALGADYCLRFADAFVPCLRPYGGTACLDLSATERGEFAAKVLRSHPDGVTTLETKGYLVVRREGPLPGSADWSHSGATAANTGASQDRFVQAPLERLWFDGSSRWMRKPGHASVRVVGGRMFIHGEGITAIDVYTGRRLWQVDLESLPPSGDNMVAVKDGVYLAGNRSCHVFDPMNGAITREISLPDEVAGAWSIIRVADDSLVGACGRWLVHLDRNTSDLIWKRKCEAGIGSLAVGGGKVFYADPAKKPPAGRKASQVSISAVDLRTGEGLWQTQGGANIRYHESSDLLCTSDGVYRAADGVRVRDAAVSLVAGDRLVASRKFADPERVISGNAEVFAILDPQSGTKIGEELQWTRRGCTVLRGSFNLLTTRFKGNAAYLDIATGGITSIWNVRAACSNNLFPADGVLNIPNLSGGCTCNYMPVSQAFVPRSVMVARPGEGAAGR